MIVGMQTSIREEPEGLASESLLLFGISFRDLTRERAIAAIRGMLRRGRCHHVVLANVHTMNLAFDDPAYHAVVARADLVLRDGVGVELASMLAGRRLESNFVGTDFIPRLLNGLSDMEPRVFLFGAAPGVAVAAGERLCGLVPGLRVVGAVDGYGDHLAIAERVRLAAPDVLLVALGNPLQETWIAARRDHLGAGVAIGVGALFDYLAGRVRRAPRWVLAARSEWIFRLVVEPRRLWRRYVLGNPRFLWRTYRAWLAGRLA